MTETSTLTGVQLAMPLYKELERRMRDALAQGEWKPGEAIPAERRLAARFGVSIGTLRKAIDELVAANILIRQQGRGTFVATHDRDRLLFYFFHVVPVHGPKQYPDVRLLAFQRARAGRAEAEALGIAAGDAVLRVRNLLSLAGAPVIVDDLTLPSARFPALTEKQFAGRPSTIYNLYQDSFGISVIRTRERLRAVLADAEAAALLGVARGAPLLSIRRVALTYNDEAVELRISRVNTAAHEYYADIGQAG
ncbi:MAG: GntR family transcriptional regulator [Betaproteobacteria bacterium]|nr:MAG: GntR family transcriptional regulator [Betaproteobacteria bacterium]